MVNEPGHILDVLSRPDYLFGLFQAERAHVFEERLFILFRVLMDRLVLARRVADDLVIHVGNVHHVLQLITALPQEPAQDIHGHEGAEVADMAVVIDGEAAGIHADCVVLRGRKFFDLI